MKKRLITFLLFVLILTNVVAQIKTILVEYTMKSKAPNGEFATFYKVLIDNNTFSCFLNKDTVTTKLQKTILKPINKKFNFGYFYNKKEDVGFYNAPIMDKEFYIKEDSLISKLKWELDTMKKTILNFTCKSAKCFFRGRNYTAFYTEEIPFYSGPWKFSGLPGLILEIYTEDELFKFEAYRFIGKKEIIEIRNPYENKNINFLSFKEHKKLLLKKILAAQNKAQTEEKDADVNYTFTDKSMEILN